MSENNLMFACYPEAAFGGFTNVDGTIRFYMRVNALVQPSSVALDIGCGRGAYADDPVPFRRQLRILRGKCQRVIGIDVDQAARENPFVDEFRPLTDERWPIEDASIDLCLSDYVLEHVQQPETFFAECARVLKPGGHLCIRTVNKCGYVALAARCIPNRFHAGLLARTQTDRLAADVFPTWYRCNTPRMVRRLM